MSDKTVLVTGGTRGIGLATGLEFGAAGARVVLTYKWGSASEEAIVEAFAARGGRAPTLLEADVSNEDDTRALLDAIARTHDGIDVFVSNVAFAQRTPTLESYKKRSFFKTLEYSAWPLVHYTAAIKERFGRYPGHVIGVSSDGGERHYPAYDFVAASKAVLESFARYLAVHIKEEGGRVNVVRFGMVKTDSFEQMFGPDFAEFLRREGFGDDDLLQPHDCGKAILALCSGLLDAMTGEVITVDRGMAFLDNMMMRYHRQSEASPAGGNRTE
ncbi:MAG: SDR family oxidoreductase [Bradymonadaceae bacterium]|nr:SDR family oxidoreductase [Lujinxingiaceae bacterium]